MAAETNAAGAPTPSPERKGWCPKWLNLRIIAGLIAAFWIGFWVHTPKGAPYTTSDQSQVLIRDVDLDKTLMIAEQELRKTGFASVLTLWGIRDQMYSPTQAATVADLYFDHIDAMQDYFRVWHMTWAVSNVYQNGNPEIRAELELAYQDARKRAKALGGWADAHVNDKILMGDIHLPARLFVRAHVVAPGNLDYLQALEDYKP